MKRQSLKHFWALFRRQFELSASVMLVYRANVFFFLFFELVFLAGQFLTVSVGYDMAGGAVAGWTREQAYLLTAVNGLSHQVFICFFINPIFSVGMQVWNGQYDYLLLKPLHPLASMWFNGQYVISNLPSLIINGIAVLYFVVVNAASGGALVAFLGLFAVGIAVRVALALACIAPVFFSERLGDVEDSFWSVAGLARYPLAVYPRFLSLLMTFVLPLGMLASVPSSALFGGQTLGTLVGSVTASIVFVFVGVKIFMLCLSRYQSVNSGV